MSEYKKRLAFLASHNGSAARAITKACLAGELPATPALLISNNPDSKALDWAEEMGLKALVINVKTHSDVDAAIAAAFEGHQIDLACCSGYMKLIGPQTIAAMNGKIWNVHPALLPNYGGKGMYGRHVHEAVAASGDTQTGITLHEVDGEYDHGRVIAQRTIPLTDTDTADTIEQKVKEAEPDFYVATLASYLSTSDRTA
jgi:phosphoribosylglycinamide formyltransferase-1